MAWIEEQTAETDAPSRDDKWLKIPDPEAVNKSTEVTFRILESEPEDIWRHWIDNNLYNCPGMETCPVCKVRNPMLKNNKEAAQKMYRTDHRFFFNVLHEGKVKTYSFGSGLARQFKVLDEKYDDLRDFDVTVIKRKTGTKLWNVEYTAIPVLPKRALSKDEEKVAEERYDLSAFTKPADKEDLLMVAQGINPSTVRLQDRNEPEEAEEESPKAAPKKATKADIMMLKALLPKDLDLSDFGIVETSPPDKTIVDQLIADLKKSK